MTQWLPAEVLGRGRDGDPPPLSVVCYLIDGCIAHPMCRSVTRQQSFSKTRLSPVPEKEGTGAQRGTSLRWARVRARLFFLKLDRMAGVSFVQHYTKWILEPSGFAVYVLKHPVEMGVIPKRKRVSTPIG